MKYNCNHTYENGKKVSWEIEADIVDMSDNTTEIEVSGRGSTFGIIVVECGSNSRFLCVPEVNIGCQMASYTDRLWNLEKLSKKMNETDAATICCALSNIGKSLERNQHKKKDAVR